MAFDNLTRAQKIKVVRESITKVGVPGVFDDLVKNSGSTIDYIAGNGIDIQDDTISVLIGDLIDNGEIVVNESGKISLSDETKAKLLAIPELKEGNSIATMTDVKEMIGKFWKQYTPDTPPVTTDGSIFVIVPETATLFNGKEESKLNPSKLYFEQSTGTIWNNGFKYGSSSSSGSWELDADEKVLYLSDNHILASDLKFECIEKDGHKFLQLTGKNNISLGEYQLDEYSEPFCVVFDIDSPTKYFEPGTPIDITGNQGTKDPNTYSHFYLFTGDNLDIKRWIPNISGVSDLFDEDGEIIKDKPFVDENRNELTVINRRSGKLTLYIHSDIDTFDYTNSDALINNDRAGFYDFFIDFEFTNEKLTKVQIKLLNTIELSSGKGNDRILKDGKITAEYILDAYRISKQLQESFMSEPTSDNPTVTLNDIKTDSNVQNSIKEIINNDLGKTLNTQISVIVEDTQTAFDTIEETITSWNPWQETNENTK